MLPLFLFERERYPVSEEGYGAVALGELAGTS